MSKRAYISRYRLIFEKLNSHPYCSFEDLQSYIERKQERLRDRDEDLEIGFSIRTFQRDKKELRELFGMNIEYSKAQKGYFIEDSVTENASFNRLLEAFDTLNVFRQADDLNGIMYYEKRRPQGTENLNGILHAIKNNFPIHFSYQKFWEDEAEKRLVEPYALKEFRNRWYVMAKDSKDNHVKSFALDRLTNLNFSKKKFKRDINVNIDKKYHDCFGIISPDDETPHEIILAFNAFQGKYIKTLPLHHSQVVLLDTKKELQIKLKLCITHDLIMELLSYGANVKVLKPAVLIREIKNAQKAAFSQYK